MDGVIFVATNLLGASGLTGAYFGSGSGPIHLDSVVCSGTEYNLTDCQTGTGTRQSTHSDDVGVKCQTSKYVLLYVAIDSTLYIALVNSYAPTIIIIHTTNRAQQLKVKFHMTCATAVYTEKAEAFVWYTMCSTLHHPSQPSLELSTTQKGYISDSMWYR